MDEVGTPQRVLVTGGAGFIGHRAVSNLLASQPDRAVAIVDNLSVGMPMPSSRERLKLYQVDVRDSAELDDVFAEFKPDTILHLAAVHHIPTCERDRAYSLDVNIVGTENVLAAAEKHRARGIVLASSGAVYSWADGPLDEEMTPLGPRDNYAIAKHANELQGRFWADRTGGGVRIARIFNTIGHDDPNGHLVPDIISQIPPAATEVEISLGNMKPRRDYIHADDTARALAMLTEAVVPGVEIYNVASGADVSVGELVEMLGRLMGVRIVVREDAARMRRVDRPSQLGRVNKLHDQLGFKAEKSLHIALEDILTHLGRYEK